jgi:hypothetical protein
MPSWTGSFRIPRSSGTIGITLAVVQRHNTPSAHESRRPSSKEEDGLAPSHKLPPKPRPHQSAVCTNGCMALPVPLTRPIAGPLARVLGEGTCTQGLRTTNGEHVMTTNLLSSPWDALGSLTNTQGLPRYRPPYCLRLNQARMSSFFYSSRRNQ